MDLVLRRGLGQALEGLGVQVITPDVALSFRGNIRVSGIGFHLRTVAAEEQTVAVHRPVGEKVVPPIGPQGHLRSRENIVDIQVGLARSDAAEGYAPPIGGPIEVDDLLESEQLLLV